MRRSVLEYLGVVTALALICQLPGCASCTSCRADQIEDTLVQTWYAVRGGDDVPPPPPTATPPTPSHALPSPQAAVPHARPVVPEQDFATPPTDGPDPAATQPDPPANPPTPDPGTSKGKGGIRLVREVDAGAVVIEQHGSGVINFHSPNPAPSTASIASAPSYPILPVPVPDQVAVGVAARVVGGMYFALTGKCPSKASAASPAGYALVPQTSFAAVPVTAAPQPPAQYVLVAQTPAPAPPAAPQYVAIAQAPAPTPGYAMVPLASPQAAAPTQPAAGRKSLSLFRCFKKSK
jgi:hypothetical protein